MITTILIWNLKGIRASTIVFEKEIMTGINTGKVIPFFLYNHFVIEVSVWEN